MAENPFPYARYAPYADEVETSTETVTSSDVTEIVVVTQAAYDLLTPDASTLYVIVN